MDPMGGHDDAVAEGGPLDRKGFENMWILLAHKEKSSFYIVLKVYVNCRTIFLICPYYTDEILITQFLKIGKNSSKKLLKMI